MNGHQWGKRRIQQNLIFSFIKRTVGGWGHKQAKPVWKSVRGRGEGGSTRYSPGARNGSACVPTRSVASAMYCMILLAIKVACLIPFCPFQRRCRNYEKRRTRSWTRSGSWKRDGWRSNDSCSSWTRRPPPRRHRRRRRRQKLPWCLLILEIETGLLLGIRLQFDLTRFNPTSYCFNCLLIAAEV